MNYKVVYFTRSGHSKRIAESIADQLNCPLIEITDNMNWKGIIGFLRAGRATLKNKPIEIKLSQTLAPEDNLIVVSPVWAGNIAQPVRIFLNSKPSESVSLILTSGGPIKEKAVDFKRYAYFGNIYSNSENQALVISDLIQSLNTHQ